MFAAQGVRGASLRHIARDAGVSLTLLSHHFGNKAQLLDAVIASHHEASLPRIAGLKALLLRTDRALDLERLVDDWVEYEFDLHDSRDGRHDLRLIMRLADEPGIDAGVRDGLDHAGPLILRSLDALRPGMSEAALAGAWLLASAALYAAIAMRDAAAPLAPPSIRLGISRFLQGGLKAYIDGELAPA